MLIKWNDFEDVQEWLKIILEILCYALVTSILD